MENFGNLHIFGCSRIRTVGPCRMGKPHALLIPCPAQGHVKPLMELAHRLAEDGFMVTFVNTESNHARIMKSLTENSSTEYCGRIRLAAVPDGLDTDEDRQNIEKLLRSVENLMPGFVEELILRINQEGDDKVTCMIIDGTIPSLASVAVKLDIKRVVFWTASAWLLAIFNNIPMLLSSGVIHENGFPKDGTPIQLSDAAPALDPAHLSWITFSDSRLRVILFHYFQKCAAAMQGVDHILCNSFAELELPFFEITRNAVPIGPLVSANRSRHQPSSFWREDGNCLDWLDQHPAGSVIYVSLGSTSMLDQHQIDELALGLELTGRPFLWVCRPGLANQADAVYPEGFMDRISGHGCVVGWAPQLEVLSHPSVACFLTHCGWNSTMEGLSNGVPMLCWPYYADQFQDQIYIVEVWKVGLGLTKSDEGLVRKEEISSKLEALLNDHGIKERVMELKDKGEKSVKEGGESFTRFHDFVSAIKGT